MGTIYKTNGYIFESDLIIEQKGVKYAIDITDLSQIKAYSLSKLATLGRKYDFIRHYHPDFDNSENVVYLDDLNSLLDNECDSEKLERLTDMWGSDPKYWEDERDRIMARLFEESMNNYKNLF